MRHKKSDKPRNDAGSSRNNAIIIISSDDEPEPAVRVGRSSTSGPVINLVSDDEDDRKYSRTVITAVTPRNRGGNKPGSSKGAFQPSPSNHHASTQVKQRLEKTKSSSSKKVAAEYTRLNHVPLRQTNALQNQTTSVHWHDSESESEWYHAGYDREFITETEVIEIVDSMNHSKRHTHTQRAMQPLSFPRPEKTQMPMINSLDSPFPHMSVGGWYQRHFASHRRRNYRRKLGVGRGLGISKLKLTDSFRTPSGPVTEIHQKEGVIAACTFTSGGSEDEGNPTTVDDYNTSGSLVFWKNGKRYVPEAHTRLVVGQDKMKYYNVTGIAFVPSQIPEYERIHQLVSIGHDQKLCLWDYSCILQEAEPSGNARQSDHYGNTDINDMDMDDARFKPETNPFVISEFNLDGFGMEVRYQPGDLLDPCLAVSCFSGQIYVYSDYESLLSGHAVILPISEIEPRPPAGGFVWGRECTANRLFASSENQSGYSFPCYHSVFDIERGRSIYPLKAQKESCDAITISSDGKTLALVTENTNSHMLRLFDVARSNKNAIETLPLEPFLHNDDLAFNEVVMATFSPDGTWLAIGRNDNQTHVYDTRFLGRSRGPIQQFAHQPIRHRGGKTHGYGVVFAEWVPSISGKDLGLVTSGGDGCVRLWDMDLPCNDPYNGQILAEVDNSIGCTHIGDWRPDRFEQTLVIGDCGGGINILNINN